MTRIQLQLRFRNNPHCVVENGALTPLVKVMHTSALGAELRYPLMLENSTSIYALGFVEAGNLGMM